MTSPLLATKLHAPRRKRDLVDRARLGDALARGAEAGLTPAKASNCVAIGAATPTAAIRRTKARRDIFPSRTRRIRRQRSCSFIVTCYLPWAAVRALQPWSAHHEKREPRQMLQHSARTRQCF